MFLSNIFFFFKKTEKSNYRFTRCAKVRYLHSSCTKVRYFHIRCAKIRYLQSRCAKVGVEVVLFHINFATRGVQYEEETAPARNTLHLQVVCFCTAAVKIYSEHLMFTNKVCRMYFSHLLCKSTVF